MKILLAIPTRESIHAATVHWMTGMLKGGDVELFIGWTGRGVEEARNQIVKYFLKSNYTHLLMVDDDVVPSIGMPIPITVDADILSFPTPVVLDGQKQLNAYKIIDGQYIPYGLNTGSAFEVDAVGGGCLLIRRGVFEEIEAPFSALKKPDGTWHMSEDLFFCKRAKDKNFSIYADFEHKSEHYSKHPLLLMKNGV